MRIADLPPLLPPNLGSAIAAHPVDAAAAAGWFDDGLWQAEPLIRADLDLASRGLGVADHAARVLACLGVPRPERA